jgi:5-methylcytosine-specific restriction endonuclease McrA
MKQQKKVPKANRGRTRIKTLTIEEVFGQLALEEKQGKSLHRRLEVFYKKGLKCTTPDCDKEGILFALELDPGQGKHIDLYTKDNELMTVDHDNPLSNGGTWDLENLFPMCEKHNAKKGSIIPEKYKKTNG